MVRRLLSASSPLLAWSAPAMAHDFGRESIPGKWVQPLVPDDVRAETTAPVYDSAA